MSALAACRNSFGLAVVWCSWLSLGGLSHYLRCRKTGEIFSVLPDPRCSECRAFGNKRADCVRPYVRAAEGGTGDNNTDPFMGEEEAEKVAAPTETAIEEAKKGTRSVPAPVSAPPPARPTTEAPAPPPAVEYWAASLPGNVEVSKAPVPDGDHTVPKMDVEVGSAKRPFDEDIKYSQGRRLCLR